METNTQIFFYSHSNGNYRCFSNFFPSEFIENNIEYNCNEQYFMKKKQELFDPLNIATSNGIMACRDPFQIKKFGRDVKNFNQGVWDGTKYEIMKQGLRLKFKQNPSLLNKLILTSTKKLYEASPYNKILGTGFNAITTLHKINYAENELGQNLLGKALEEVRDELR